MENKELGLGIAGFLVSMSLLSKLMKDNKLTKEEVISIINVSRQAVATFPCQRKVKMSYSDS
jgi:chorismate mutase